MMGVVSKLNVLVPRDYRGGGNSIRIPLYLSTSLEMSWIIFMALSNASGWLGV